jgi:hypothetical protein
VFGNDRATERHDRASSSNGATHASDTAKANASGNSAVGASN